MLYTFDVALAQENSSPAEDVPAAPGLHARLFDSHLEMLSGVCAGKEQRLECIDEVWGIADVSGDDQLSIAEITRMLRIISGKLAHRDYVIEYEKYQSSPSSKKKPSPPKSQESVVVFGTAAVGPVVSHALIGNYDYDDNGLPSKAEILQDLVEDTLLSSVDTLPSEIQSRASEAAKFLLQFLMKK